MSQRFFDPPLRFRLATPRTKLFQAANTVVKRLREAGFESYLVGGSIRDLVGGIEPQDYDIATSAHPERVQELFSKTVPVGLAFGTLLVLWNQFSFEVTTFRSDGRYLDGRRPISVTFSSIQEDVKRRDFTINGLLFDPETSEVLDYVGGVEDLSDRVVRTIGEPLARFREDRLRMLRAIRFTVRLSAKMEPETFEAIQKMAPRLCEVSAERIQQELQKMLNGHSFSRLGALLDASGLMDCIFPKLKNTACFINYLKGLEHFCESSLRMRLAVFLLGVSLEDAVESMHQLRFSKELVNGVCELLEQGALLSEFPTMSISQKKRFLRRPHTSEMLEIATIKASMRSCALVSMCRDALVAWKDQTLFPERLLNGHELKRCGYPPGPLYREILEGLEDAQLEGRVSDGKQAYEWLATHFPQKVHSTK